jgi:energy-converting hydrogenase A subunit M
LEAHLKYWEKSGNSPLYHSRAYHSDIVIKLAQKALNLNKFVETLETVLQMSVDFNKLVEFKKKFKPHDKCDSLLMGVVNKFIELSNIGELSSSRILPSIT